MKFWWWLVRPLFLWVASRLTSDKVKESLELDETKPTLYVLPKRSFVDLLILYYHCKKFGLPLPTTDPTFDAGQSGNRTTGPHR